MRQRPLCANYSPIMYGTRITNSEQNASWAEQKSLYFFRRLSRRVRCGFM